MPPGDGFLPQFIATLWSGWKPQAIFCGFPDFTSKFTRSISHLPNYHHLHRKSSVHKSIHLSNALQKQAKFILPFRPDLASLLGRSKAKRTFRWPPRAASAPTCSLRGGRRESSTNANTARIRWTYSSPLRDSIKSNLSLKALLSE
jgi:hypothetical protein